MDFQDAFFNTKDYELTKESLGHGAFGTVYKAKSKKDGEDYAVKIIRTENGFSGEQQMQLMRESMILRELHHPNIVQFIGINFQSFTDPNKLEPSIITEFLRNGSLKDILDKEKQSLSASGWTPTKKYITLLGISSAMKYLHQKKIIHRDLKPQNILMDSNYYPRVCDFGLSRCLPDSYSKSMNKAMTGEIGTPLYMSPELLRGETEYDPSVDIYAFSILAYEIVTGKEPYYELGRNVTPFVLATKVMSGYRPKFNNDCSEKMIVLLTKCWSDNITERPTFDEIYTLLSSDFSYFDETIDEEEVNEFIENSLTEILKNGSYNPDEDFFHVLATLHGEKNNKPSDNILSTLMFSSNKGSGLSSYLLGLMYESGEIECDFEKAEHFYKKAAEQGNSNGLQRLGLCYTRGIGVDCDYSKALDCYQKSAELGNSRSICNLGQCYKSGFGVEKDLGKAFEFIHKAAELGNPSALYNLALYYEKGSGVSKDYKKAFEYYEKAADLGHPPSLFCLGYYYEKGTAVEKDYEKAAHYYMKAAELGESSALCNLGLFYKRGNGVEQDYAKMLDCLTKAGKQGHGRAMHNLGVCYEYGEGVQKDVEKAIECYKKAVELGHAESLAKIKKLNE